MITVDLKTTPDVKRVVLAAFPDYRKHKAFISVFGEHGVNINSYWDGGSRTEWALVNMLTGKRHSLPTSSHPYFDVARQGMANQDNGVIETDRVGNAKLKVLPDNFALVSAGISCGKPATAHLFIPAANMAKLLPSAGGAQ